MHRGPFHFAKRSPYFGTWLCPGPLSGSFARPFASAVPPQPSTPSLAPLADEIFFEYRRQEQEQRRDHELMPAGNGGASYSAAWTRCTRPGPAGSSTARSDPSSDIPMQILGWGTLPQTDALRRTTSYRVLDPRPAALHSCPSWRCRPSQAALHVSASCHNHEPSQRGHGHSLPAAATVKQSTPSLS
jgi:hypothetical protein